MFVSIYIYKYINTFLYIEKRYRYYTRSVVNFVSLYVILLENTGFRPHTGLVSKTKRRVSTYGITFTDTNDSSLLHLE